MIAAYARVSTAEQAKEGYSIGEQQQRLKDYCKARGWAAPRMFTDAGYSGGNTDRPALQELLAEVKKGRVEKVLVYKLDRLSRSQKDTLILLEDVFLSAGVAFVSISENFDTGTPIGRALVGLLAVFAQLERDQIKERVSLGREARAKSGKYHGGSVPPIGYDYIDGELVKNDFEAMQVQEAFRLITSGHTLTEIMDTFNNKGWTHKYGVWNITTIKRILKNPVYLSKVKFDSQLYQGTQEAIIDEETFNAAQAVIEKNNSFHRESHDYPLLGLMWCKRCGARYTHFTAQKCKYRYYRCATSNSKIYKAKYGDCVNASLNAKEFDEMIYSQVRGLSLSDVKRERKKKDPDTSKPILKELEKIDKQRSRLIDLYSMGDFSADELQEKIAPLTERKRSLESQLIQPVESRTLDEMSTVIDSIDGILDSGDNTAIKKLLRELIERIDIDGDEVIIHWNFN